MATTATQEASTAAPDYPRPGAAWYIVILLTIAYIFSFVDRYILGLLVEPIKADMGLSDTQIGLLLGPAFAIFYATMGLPLGWLADRWKRTWLVGIGVALWSAATAASGLAKTFGQLFIARMAVGVGEATLSPCAMSIIGDSFPKERRGKPIAVYTAALSIGAALASLIGASVLVWTKSSAGVELPAIGTVKPWQLAFFIVGTPGLVFAGLFFLLREPKRQIEAADDPALTGSNLNDMLAYVGRRWKLYLSYMLLVCVMMIVAYSQGWYAAMFERTWDWAPERYAFWNAMVLLAVGPATVWTAGWLSDRLTSQGVPDAPQRILIAFSFLLIPTAIAIPLMPSGTLAFVMIAFNTIGIAGVSAVSVTGLLIITPVKIRAQTIALYYMVASFAGLGLGPTTVGLLSQNVFGEENLRYACAALPVLYGIIPLLLIPVTRRLYRVQMRTLDPTLA